MRMITITLSDADADALRRMLEATVAALGGNDQPPPIAVRTPAALYEALNAATGGEVIALGPGTYDHVGLTGRTWATPVTIRAAERGAVAIRSIRLSSCAGLNFEEITFGTSADDFVGASLSGCQRITFDQCKFTLNVKGMKIGVDRAATPSEDITVRACEFVRLQSDGIFAAQTSRLTVEDCAILDFRPVATQHPDAFQTVGGMVDMTLRNNVIIDTGTPMQGLFGWPNLGHTFLARGAVIEGNVLIMSAWNALALDGLTDWKCEGNIVASTGIALPGQTQPARVRLWINGPDTPVPGNQVYDDRSPRWRDLVIPSREEAGSHSEWLTRLRAAVEAFAGEL